MTGGYVNTIYDPVKRPVTSYPDRLVEYVIGRYSMKRKRRVLDSGSGRGDFAMAFARAGMDTWAIDGSHYEKAKENGVVFVGDFDLERGRMPFRDSFFDVVFSKSVLEHIHRPDVYLSEIYRVLKPGGILVCLVPDWHSQMYIYYDDFSHVQPYTVKGVEDTLRVFGFDRVSAELFYQLPAVWRHPGLKVICRILQMAGGPVKSISKNKFYRFSRELMILGSGRKGRK